MLKDKKQSHILSICYDSEYNECRLAGIMQKFSRKDVRVTNSAINVGVTIAVSHK